MTAAAGERTAAGKMGQGLTAHDIPSREHPHTPCPTTWTLTSLPCSAQLSLHTLLSSLSLEFLL